MYDLKIYLSRKINVFTKISKSCDPVTSNMWLLHKRLAVYNLESAAKSAYLSWTTTTKKKKKKQMLYLKYYFKTEDNFSSNSKILM